MVCIIDDREDVWKFAPNLITVKKYIYFQGTGDINAPPGSREAQMAKKGKMLTQHTTHTHYVYMHLMHRLFFCTVIKAKVWFER